MVSVGRQDALQIVYEAQQKNIERMLDAWDKEIEAAIEAQIAEQKKRAKLEAQAAAVEGQLQALIAQAQAGHIVTIPSGIQVASSAIICSVGDELAALSDILEDLRDVDPALRSAAWAMGNGFMPHPADLAAVMFKNEVDSAWAEAFAGLGHELKALDTQPTAIPRLAADNGAQRLDVLKRQQDLQRNYGGSRLAQVVLQPDLLKGAPLPLSPVVKSSGADAKPSVLAALSAFRGQAA